MENIEFLYHYTSIETLALILNNQSICFNNLMNVDDIEEAESLDIRNFGKYVNVSCWTNDSRESIALWSLYTPAMHGVRIKMPIFPFKKYHYKAGEFAFKTDTESYINFDEIVSQDSGSITADQPKLIKVTYSDADSDLMPQVRVQGSHDDALKLIKGDIPAEGIGLKYSLEKLGKFKRTDWAFQKEWRYIITSSPMSLKDQMEKLSFELQQEYIKRLENPDTKPPYDKLFLELDDGIFEQTEIVIGPRATDAEVAIVHSLAKEYGINTIEKSTLRIR